MQLQCYWEVKMEILDLYDKDKRLTNIQVSRGVKVPKGYYRLVVHMCIFNKEGKMLIQKRAAHKHWGSKWDISVGGCVTAGETSGESANTCIVLHDMKLNFQQH